MLGTECNSGTVEGLQQTVILCWGTGWNSGTVEGLQQIVLLCWGTGSKSGTAEGLQKMLYCVEAMNGTVAQLKECNRL